MHNEKIVLAVTIAVMKRMNTVEIRIRQSDKHTEWALGDLEHVQGSVLVGYTREELQALVTKIQSELSKGKK